MVVHILADFNGLFGDVLCLSHSDTAPSVDGCSVTLSEGMNVLAFEPDEDVDGSPNFLVARGVVARSPMDLVHAGSRWCLMIDSQGVKHVAKLGDA